MRAPLYTIGHSTRSLDEFLDLLRENGVRQIADIRRYPGSRRFPHFSCDALQESLPLAGIGYRHMTELGGRRKSGPDSPNGGWRNEQFRAYADHMATGEFRQAVDQLLELSADGLLAVMCAEAVPWRCHRNLLSDELVRRGLNVVHIIGLNALKPHELHPMARDCGDHLEYPPEQIDLSLGPTRV